MISIIIFILLSIKTRIETTVIVQNDDAAYEFLSYYPLKQGLKRMPELAIPASLNSFLSYYPLKQGLKHFSFILFGRNY